MHITIVDMIRKPCRHAPRWLQLRLRTVIVLTSLLGSWMGIQFKWILDRHRMEGTNHEGLIVVRGVIDETTGQPIGVRAPWSIRLFGEDGVDAILVQSAEGGSSNLDEVKRLFPEAEVGVLPARRSPSMTASYACGDNRRGDVGTRLPETWELFDSGAPVDPFLELAAVATPPRIRLISSAIGSAAVTNR